MSFCHIWAWRPSWSCDPDATNKFSFPLLKKPSFRGALWLSGRASDSGARGWGFENYFRRVVSLSKTLYSPKVLVIPMGSGGSVTT